jgi:hypothetical protein
MIQRSLVDLNAPAPTLKGNVASIVEIMRKWKQEFKVALANRDPPISLRQSAQYAEFINGRIRATRWLLRFRP